MRAVTPAEKLAIVEALIEAHRWARSDPAVPEHRTWEALKAIAADLRADEPRVASKALETLDYRIDRARQQKARLGYYEIGHLQGIAEELIGRWPVVRKALERYQQELAP